MTTEATIDKTVSREDASRASGRRAARLLLLLVLSGAWLLLDRISKAYFAKALADGTVQGPFAGILQFSLIHNTGGAWGIFSDSTFALGVFALIVSVALALYAIYDSAHSGVCETVGLALVVAGGIGNAIDRFAFGFVVDFIDPVFVEFPVFNIADIGVTCGFALFLIAFFIRMRREEKQLEKCDAKLPEGNRHPCSDEGEC